MKTVVNEFGVFYFNQTDGQYRFKPAPCLDLSEPVLERIQVQLTTLNEQVKA